MRSASSRDVQITVRRVNFLLGFEHALGEHPSAEGAFDVERQGTHLIQVTKGRGERDVLWGTRNEVLCWLEGFESALELARKV